MRSLPLLLTLLVIPTGAFTTRADGPAAPLPPEPSPACAVPVEPACAPVCSFRKECVAVPDVKKTPKTTYQARSEDYCSPTFCGFFKILCGKCCAGDCCGKVHTRHYVLKTTTTTECPSRKCVVQEVPCP